jgi:putative CocE/NonD family hydrolase
LEAQTPLSYLHDPENPVQTIGGGNLTLTTPIVEKTNAGPLNLANPVWAPLTMDRPDVLQFETLPFADSLCVIGYPKMKLFVSTEVDGGGHTDTDFFVRMVDVYPDGRQIYVSEGAVNGRARDYAQSIALGSPNPNADYTNLESGQIYELNFRMMPMAYTFGKDHKMKLLVSSSNYPRYQSNPNLPIESGEFFRRDVMDGQTYNFNGVEMTPRVATQKIYNAPQMPSQIILPVYLNHDVAVDEPKIHHPTVSIFPNPSRGNMHIVIDNQDYKVIKLSNMSGQNIITLENNLSNTELDITIFDPGIYLLEIYQKNMKIETLKIVILK